MAYRREPTRRSRVPLPLSGSFLLEGHGSWAFRPRPRHALSPGRSKNQSYPSPPQKSAGLRGVEPQQMPGPGEMRPGTRCLRRCWLQRASQAHLPPKVISPLPPRAVRILTPPLSKTIFCVSFLTGITVPGSLSGATSGRGLRRLATPTLSTPASRPSPSMIRPPSSPTRQRHMPCVSTTVCSPSYLPSTQTCLSSCCLPTQTKPLFVQSSKASAVGSGPCPTFPLVQSPSPQITRFVTSHLSSCQRLARQRQRPAGTRLASILYCRA